MIPENVKLARESILGLVKEAGTVEAVLRSMKRDSKAQVEVVIGVDRETWDAFTDEDGPMKEFTTFMSRRLADRVEITAYKEEGGD